MGSATYHTMTIKQRLMSAIISVSLLTPIWASGPMIALTFDDGPIPGATEELIQLLERHRVRATFLVTGRACERYPELVRLVATSGHELGNHSYSHMRLTGLTDDQIGLELRATSHIIETLIGKKVTWYRPPGGLLDARVIHAADEADLKLATWDVNAADAKTPDKSLSPDEVRVYQDRLLSKIKSGSIILMHNGSRGTLQVLPGLIVALESKGYHCVTLTELDQHNRHRHHR